MDQTFIRLHPSRSMIQDVFVGSRREFLSCFEVLIPFIEEE